MTKLEHLDIETLPARILGMQKLEKLFNQRGYLICQSSGERIYDFDEIVAIFIPLSQERDQVMAVHSDRVTAFIQSLPS
jgi:prephenate dehydrogenase